MKIRRFNGSTWVQEYPEVNVDAIVATGTPSSTTFLRGDGAWATPASGSFLPLSGGTLTGTLTSRAIAMQNYNLTQVGALQFNDPGPNEGIDWSGGNFKIYESPDDLTTNSAGNLQFVSGGSRRLTVKNSGVVDVPGTLTAGAATIDGQTALHRTNRDDTYEFHDASDLAVGWYTIATNTGDRAIAKFGLRDTDSSRHQSVIFYAAHHYGNDDSNTITVLHNSSFGTTPFRYIRIKDGGTYDGAALQIYIDNANNNVRALKLGDNFQSSGWVLKDWIADATDPGDLSNYSSFTEKGKIDLDQINQGGIATTGPIFAGGNTTQYQVLTTNDSVNADTLDSINSTSFLRSDADDNYNGILSLGSTSTIKLPNSAQYGIRTSDGYRVIDSIDGTLRIGDTGKHTLTTLHGQGNDDFKVYYNNTHYTLYHEGNKPSAADVGAAAASHEHDIDEINGLIESNSFSGTYSPMFYIGTDNRIFTKSGGITFTGSTDTLAVAGDVTVGGTSVSLSGHTHGSYDNAGTLTGANVYSQVAVTDGIVTGLTSRTLTASDISAAALSGATFTGDVYSPRFIMNPSSGGNDTAGAWGVADYDDKLSAVRDYITDSYYPIYHEAYKPAGYWTEIKGGTDDVDTINPTTGTVINLDSGTVDDTSVIAFELNTSGTTSYTSQVHIVKLENSNSIYAGILFNAYASNTLIQTGSLRVYRGANTTSIVFNYVYKHSSGSSSESADAIQIGKIWKLEGVTGT